MKTKEISEDLESTAESLATAKDICRVLYGIIGGDGGTLETVGPEAALTVVTVVMDYIERAEKTLDHATASIITA